MDDWHPFWKHTMITVMLCFFIFPIGPSVYLIGLCCYYCVPWGFRVLSGGPERAYYYPVRRLVWSIGLAAAFGVYIAWDVSNVRSQVNEIGLAAHGMYATAVATPIFYVLLLIGSIPFRIFALVRQWIHGRRERQNHEQYLRESAIRQQQAAGEAQRRAEAQKRRVDARAACELIYNLHAPDLGNRFPRGDFDAFVEKYMSDSHEAVDVESRARELHRLIERHLAMAKPIKRPRTIEELSAWYLAEKEQIDALGIDPRMKKEQLFALNSRYSELTQDLLEKMEP